MRTNPLLALQNLVSQDNQMVGALDATINRAVAPFFGQQPAPSQAQPPVQLASANPFNIEFAMGPRRPNPPAEQVTNALGGLASSVLGEGATVRVTSGMGEYGSPRHRGGLAADVQFIDPQGNPITLNDPRARDLALSAPRFGITGFGAGEEYMGDRTFHMDMFPPDQYTPNMGHTWGSFGSGIRNEFVSALGDTDEIYRNVGSALGVTVSSSGSLDRRDRAEVEATLGSILNEVYDPETAAADERQHSIADFVTGLGVGFGQMSRGNQVNLSELRTAADNRRAQNIQLRMARARRAAGASYAMELGDEGMARAIAGGAADVDTLLTARQQDIVNRRADEAIVRQAQQAGYLADALTDVLPSQMVDAIRGGADPTAILRADELRRAAEAAAQTQERIDDQIAFIQGLQAEYGATAANRADALGEAAPQVDPIIQRALMLAAVDDNARIRNGGSFAGYMEEARLQVSALSSGESGGYTLSPGQVRFDDDNTPVAEVPAESSVSAAEQEIARLMSLGHTREQAILAQSGVLQLDSDGVLRNTITGEPVTPPTAGLSAPVDQAQDAAPPAQPELVGPAFDTTGTSLFNRVGQATGALSAGAGLLESTVGQVVPGALFPERAQTVQELNTLRGVLVDAFRNSGRLLSQELQLLLEEVAPGSSIWQSPGQLEARMVAIDRELRQRLEEERARAVDPGVPTRERTASANLARDIERVLTRLHQPAPGAVQDTQQEGPPAQIPDEVRQGAGFATLERLATEQGVAPEIIWQFMPESDRRLFMED